MKIIGAGISGLLAGCMFPGSTIYERQGSLPNNHGAILRFRTPEIGQALGIPFKKVRVTKAILLDDYLRWQSTPLMQNLYSYKVLGKYVSRSIMNIDSVDRWIAPPNFIEQLAARCEIIYDYEFTVCKPVRFPNPIISTIPMPMMLDIFTTLEEAMFDPLKFPKFEHQRIWTKTYSVSNVDLYQTIYFPGPETALYRASFTGNKLICEFICDPDDQTKDAKYPLFFFGQIMDPFGLHSSIGFAQSDADSQKYGKIVDIDNNIRRSIMRDLTTDHNIYSLGRYATWRNILLDDVFKDIRRIRDMVMMDEYKRHMTLTEEN